MTETLSLLQEGGMIMLLGIGVVLAFLVILIACMVVMSKVVGYLNTIFPEAVAEPAKSKAVSATKEDEQIAIAIAAVMARA